MADFAGYAWSLLLWRVTSSVCISSSSTAALSSMKITYEVLPEGRLLEGCLSGISDHLASLFGPNAKISSSTARQQLAQEERKEEEIRRKSSEQIAEQSKKDKLVKDKKSRAKVAAEKVKIEAKKNANDTRKLLGEEKKKRHPDPNASNTLRKKEFEEQELAIETQGREAEEQRKQKAQAKAKQKAEKKKKKRRERVEAAEAAEEAAMEVVRQQAEQEREARARAIVAQQEADAQASIRLPTPLGGGQGKNMLVVQEQEEEIAKSILRSRERLREMLTQHKLQAYLEPMALQLNVTTVKEFSVLEDAQFEKIGVLPLHLRKLLEMQNEVKAVRLDAVADERLFCEVDGNEVISSPLLVGDYGAAAAQHVRPTMEDEHVAFANLMGTHVVFGVYDGHGGRQVASLLKDKLVAVFEDKLFKLKLSWNGGLEGNKSAVEEVMRQTFRDADELIIKMLGDDAYNCGSTVGLLLLRRDGNTGELMLHAANAGDVRAVLVRGQGAVRLTLDHKADDPGEVARIEALGGQVTNGRLREEKWGTLAVTRAMGDTLWKPFVTSEPHITSTLLCHRDTYIVQACDGLWDKLEDEQVADIIADMPPDTSCQNIAKQLITHAIKAGTSDNVSVQVIRLPLIAQEQEQQKPNEDMEEEFVNE